MTKNSNRRLVVRNARLGLRGWTGDVAIAGGRVESLGVVDARPDDDVVDAGGRVLVPGLWDAHVHFDQWATWRQRIDVMGSRSARHAAELIAAAVGQGPAVAGVGQGPAVAGVVRAYGFRDGLWAEPPHKDLLDEALPGAPVVVQSNDLHTGWFSSAALDLIGAGDHDTGVFKEGACHRAVAALPPIPAEDVDQWALEAASAAAARGVTGVLDFERPDNLTAWSRRARAHRLDIRVTAGITRERLDDAIAAGRRTGAVVPGTGGMVEVGPLKLFVDGSLNSRTALCFDPYPSTNGTGTGDHGVVETEPDELRRTMARAAEHGLHSAVHAIGDRANRIALDAFEEVGCGGRIEHVQLLADADFARVGLPGLTLGVQPAHMPDDRDVADRHWHGRTAGAFAYAGMLAAGGRLEIGSDAPVSPLDPWDGIASAVTRTDDDRPPWHPEQALTVADALAAASRGRRAVREGEPADLVLLDDDPAGMDPAGLRAMRVAGTLVGGRWTHRAL